MRRIFNGKRIVQPGEVTGAFWLRLLLSIAALYVVLIAPAWPDGFTRAAFLRLPVELPLLMLLLSLPARGFGRFFHGLIVAALSIFTVVKLANLVAFLGFARPFNFLVDPFLIPIAVETLSMNSVSLGVGVVLGVAGLSVMVIELGRSVLKTRMFDQGPHPASCSLARPRQE